jgi:hypothetical protein
VSPYLVVPITHDDDDDDDDDDIMGSRGTNR